MKLLNIKRKSLKKFKFVLIYKKIYGKTGTGTDGTAWFIGFVEKENTNIYFAIYLDDDSSNEISGIKAQEIAFNILEE